jgi:hypothetical protein
VRVSSRLWGQRVRRDATPRVAARVVMLMGDLHVQQNREPGVSGLAVS